MLMFHFHRFLFFFFFFLFFVLTSEFYAPSRKRMRVISRILDSLYHNIRYTGDDMCLGSGYSFER